MRDISNCIRTVTCIQHAPSAALLASRLAQLIDKHDTAVSRLWINGTYAHLQA